MHTDHPAFRAPGQDDADNPMLALLSRYAALMRRLRLDDTLTAEDCITVAVATRFIYTRTLEQTGRLPYAAVADAATRVQFAVSRERSAASALRNRISFDRPFAEEATW